MVVKNYMFVK